jgi:hypothetical protein
MFQSRPIIGEMKSKSNATEGQQIQLIFDTRHRSPKVDSRKSNCLFRIASLQSHYFIFPVLRMPHHSGSADAVVRPRLSVLLSAIHQLSCVAGGHPFFFDGQFSIT